MAEATTNTTTIIARADQHDIDLHKASDRVNFGSIREPIDVPYLLGVQTDSFDWLIGNERWQKRVQEDLENGTNTVPHTSGLDEVFQEISPIENFAQTMSLTFSDPYFEEPRHTVQECKEKDYTYSAPLYVNAEFENGDTGEIKSQTVFMGDFPLQTPHGTSVTSSDLRYPYSNIFSTFVSGFCAFCEFCSASFVIAAKNKNDERHSNFFTARRMVGGQCA